MDICTGIYKRADLEVPVLGDGKVRHSGGSEIEIFTDCITVERKSYTFSPARVLNYRRFYGTFN